MVEHASVLYVFGGLGSMGMTNDIFYYNLSEASPWQRLRVEGGRHPQI